MLKIITFNKRQNMNNVFKSIQIIKDRYCKQNSNFRNFTIHYKKEILGFSGEIIFY